MKTSELPRSKSQEISHKVSIIWIPLAKPTSGHIPGGIFPGAALVWWGGAGRGKVQWEARLSHVCLFDLRASCMWPMLLIYHTYLVPADP